MILEAYPGWRQGESCLRLCLGACHLCKLLPLRCLCGLLLGTLSRGGGNDGRLIAANARLEAFHD